jgi:hypothetical protein
MEKREALITYRGRVLEQGVGISKGQGDFRRKEGDEFINEQTNESAQVGSSCWPDNIYNSTVTIFAAKKATSGVGSQGLTFNSLYFKIPSGPNAGIFMQKYGTKGSIGGKDFKENRYPTAISDLVVDGHLAEKAVNLQSHSFSHYEKNEASKRVQQLTPECLVQYQGKYYVRRTVLKETIREPNHALWGLRDRSELLH